MINVSTKTGDQGQTSLANGMRVAKSSLVFDCIGTLDELNSYLGLVITYFSDQDEQQKILFAIQHDLFVIGAELAQSPQVKFPATSLKQVEKSSLALQKSMSGNWHSKFLLPGGSRLGAFLDISRTISRRLERVLWRYHSEREISPLILQYANRLSDYLYVLRCFVNLNSGYKDKEFRL